ncbi:MAG TPA: restriction endonuclease [Syntrophorhabdus sp.]|jgi:restriction system protein|nr:restriction endonuclease [Syntrophorhabdus sp.]
MPRKKSLIEDLAAILPWWALVILAVIAHFALKYWIPSMLLFSQGIEPSSVLFLPALVRVLPLFSLIVPMVILLAAILSAFTSWKKRGLLDCQKGFDTLRNISWKEFEELVGEAYRRKGYAVTECGGGGADGGVDLVLKRGGEKFLVQCKHWRIRKIGVKIVRELYGVVHAEEATGGIVISSGSFTQEARDFAKGKPLRLLDGTDLLTIIKEVQKTSGPARNNDEIFCPNCGSPMVLRSSKKASHQGEKFWGCSAFPKCRTIKPYNP